MGNGVAIKEPTAITKTLYSGSNQYIKAIKYGNVVTLHIYNVSPSTLLNLSIPQDLQPGLTVDGSIGWIWDSTTDTSRPLFARITGSTVSILLYYSGSQGKLVNVSDSLGAMFACVSYCV